MALAELHATQGVSAGGAARSTFKVREHIKQFPLTWAIGAFLLGAWLGSRGGPAQVAGRRRA